MAKLKFVHISIIALLALALSGCLESKSDSAEESSLEDRQPQSFSDISSTIDSDRDSKLDAELKSSDLTKAIRSASLKIMRRLPTLEEIEMASENLEGYGKVIDQYLESDEFKDTIHEYFKNTFKMGNKVTDGINYSEPANLLTYIVINNIDYREAITATYCISNNLERINCRAFANEGSSNDQGAGVLTTQAFLVEYATAFNFARVREAFQHFACQEYPNHTDPGMRAEYIASDQATFNATEGTAPCLGCHQSINPVAVQFYVFDRKGFYNTNPNPNVARGEITKRVTDEASQISDLLNNNAQPTYHGEPINSVREYATLFSNNKLFSDCIARRFGNLVLGENYMSKLPGDLSYLKERVKKENYKVKPILKAALMSRRFMLLR